MLVKFDHITYVVNENNLISAKKALVEAGYIEKFHEENIDNPTCKAAYLHKGNFKHSLYFFDSPSSIPVEIVSYAHTTQEPHPIDFELGSLDFTCKVVSTEQSIDFYKALGACETEQGMLEMKGLLDAKTFRISFVEKHGCAINLDNEGWCCPTLIVDSYKKTKMQLENSGYYCSEADAMIVNGRTLLVFFAVGKENEIIEIISNK